MSINHSEFIKLVGNKRFVKFINNTYNHHGFVYKLGENKDTNNFKPFGSCAGGGLYFTTYENASYWSHFGIIFADIKLCDDDDAEFYIEPCGTKYKTNKFIVDKMVNLDLQDDQQYSLDICKIAIMQSWKIFHKINYYSLCDKNSGANNEYMSYNNAIVNNDANILHSVDNLLKNEFEINNIDDKFLSLSMFVSFQDNVCIAGGFPTILYHEKNLDDFPDSDIDIFIMNTNSENNKQTLDEIITLLDCTWKIKSIEINSERKIKKKCGVFDILCFDFPRKIQIILTMDSNIAMLLSRFDASYCKCCIYKNDTYITPDAKITKETGYTCFYTGNPLLSRMKKAQKIGLNVLNYNQYDKYTDYSNNAKIMASITKEDVLEIADSVSSWNGYNLV